MNRRRAPILIPALLLGIGTSFFISENAGGAGTSDSQKLPAARPPVIRLDLLDAGTDDILPPVRDIFIPKPAVSVSGASDRSDLAGLSPSDRRFPEVGGALYRQPVHLTYTGYVSSGPFYIALIVYQGQPMAVAEEEEIGPGIRVVRITPESLEIAEPDSGVKAFPIEGDLP